MNTVPTDIGSEIKTVLANYSQVAPSTGTPVAIVAAGANDNQKSTGVTIDRTGFESAQLTVAGATTLGAGESLTMAAEIQESDDASSWDAAVALYAATSVATSVGGGNVAFEKRTSLNLRGRKRYFRINTTPNLSAGAADVAVFTADVSLGGAIEKPVS